MNVRCCMDHLNNDNIVIEVNPSYSFYSYLSEDKKIMNLAHTLKW